MKRGIFRTFFCKMYFIFLFFFHLLIFFCSFSTCRQKNAAENVSLHFMRPLSIKLYTDNPEVPIPDLNGSSLGDLSDQRRPADKQF